VAEVAFAARLRRAMEEAGITTAAELERRWVDRFGGKPANVHRQVMRLLNHTEWPRPVTVERLAALTGRPAGYFTDGQPERRRSRLADLEDRQARLAEVVAEYGEDLSQQRQTLGEQGALLADVASELRAQLEQLDSRVQALEQ
jgi:hypothetical protein